MFRFIIRFLKVLAIACIIGVGLRVIDVVFYKQKVYETDKEITSENVVADNSKESISQPIENIVITEEQKEVKQEENIVIKENKEAETVITKSNETVKKETKQQTKQEIKEETTQTQTVTKQEQTSTSQIIENKQEEQQEEQKQQEEIKKEDGKVEEQEPVKEEQEEKQEEIKVEEDKQEQIITEEYKINEQMINKIKLIIENNETADMKTYGYEIVVDSTIPELTNEFTFTEQRVINKITWKCGIIKIYARDYYFNGNYISTQCFII